MDRKSWVILTLTILLVVSIIGSIFLGSQLLLITKNNVSNTCDGSTSSNTVYLASNVSQPLSIDKNVSSVCDEVTCLLTASRLYHEMDQSIDPCDDFYQFACGGFINSIEVPNNLIEVGKFTDLHKKVNEVIKTKLEDFESINESKYFKLAQKLYIACLVYKENLETSIVLDEFKNWPISKGTEWKENSSDINTIIFKLDNITYRQNYFFEFDFVDTEIMVGPYSCKLFTVEDLIQGVNNDQIKNYYNTMTSEAKKIHDNVNYDDELNEILNFEIELGRERLSKDQIFDPNFDTVQMTLNELTNNFSFFNWQEHINYLHGSPVNLSTIVTINNFGYMKKLKNLFNSTETKRIIANYVIWKHIEDFISNTRFIKAHECVDFILSKLPIAAGAIYVQSHNYTKIINDEGNILKMILNIKEKFHEMIQNADWIDDETKTKSTNKLKLSKNTIGFINYLTNNSKLDEFYENLEISDDENIYQTIERIKLFDQKKLMMHGDDNELANYGMQLKRESIYHNNALNSIEIPYTMLQSVFFDSEKPNYMNYGALGMLIGHEIAHSYDMGGINFDGQGNWNLSQWTQFSKNNLHNKSKCIIEQYNNFTVPVFKREYGGHLLRSKKNGFIKLNGSLTQRETVADNGGIKAAYRAYEKLSNTDKKLPGLDYTPKQLFWISYANTWCIKYDKEYLSYYIDDVHPPANFRVIGTLSNSLEFAKDFNCPSGSNMNPTKKCSFW